MLAVMLHSLELIFRAMFFNSKKTITKIILFRIFSTFFLCTTLIKVSMPKNILYFTTKHHSARFQWVQLPLPTHPDRTFSLSSLPNFYSTMTTLTRTVKPPKQRVRSLYFPPFSSNIHPIFPGKSPLPLSCLVFMRAAAPRSLFVFPHAPKRAGERERASRVLFENNKDPVGWSSCVRSPTPSSQS